jgi:hypothetical protein
MVLDDVLDEMAMKAWDMMKGELQDEQCQADYDSFRRAIREAMSPQLKAYQLCGLAHSCNDEVEGTDWSFETHALDAGPRDLIYQLELEGDLEAFVDALSEAALQPVRQMLKPGRERRVLSLLRIIFRFVIGDYLYYNPVCGKMSFCPASQSTPLPCWVRG